LNVSALARPHDIELDHGNSIRGRPIKGCVKNIEIKPKDNQE